MKRYRFLLIAGLFLAACSKKAEEQKPESLSISGTIQIDPALLKQVRDTDTIFLIARPASGGPPVAVEKFAGRNYPYAFTLTEKNIMIPIENLDVPLNLTVRVDKDGDPMTKKPGDLAGTYEKNPVSLRSEGLTVLVNELLK